MRRINLGWAVLLGLLVIVGLSSTESLRAQSAAEGRAPVAAAEPAARQPELRATAAISGTWSAEFAQGIETLALVTDIITTTGGDWYIVGDFNQVAGVDARGIARWDGDQWSAVAPTKPPGHLTQIALYQDEIYVVTEGGYRTTNAGLWRYNAATQQWSRIGFPSYVESEEGAGNFHHLIVYNDLLIAGGNFEEVNDAAMTGLVAWDGTAFRSITPITTTSRFDTHDLVITPDGLVAAGGYRPMPGDDSVVYLGSWDGTNWNALSSPLPVILDLAWDGAKLYIFDGLDEIKRWDGNQWSHVSTVPDYTTLVGVIDGKPYTRTCDPSCATMTLERWQGDTPENLGTYRTRAAKSGLAEIIGGDIYLGGANTLPDGGKHALLRYRDGALAGVFGRIVAVGPPLDLALDQDRLYVATDADFTGPLTASSGMAWEDGAWSRWWPGDARASTNVVRHVRVLGHDDLLIGGTGLTVSPTRTTALARRTEGRLSSLDPQHHCATVRTTVYSGTTLLAVCNPTPYDFEVAAFDGAQWSQLASDRLDDPDGVAYVSDIGQIGYYRKLYGLLREYGPYSTPADGYYVYAWSGTEWSKLTIANAPLRALAQAPDGLYVANARLYRAAGDGFEEVAATNGEIRTILVDGERIWIGGEFSEVDGVAANNIALWDGQAWHALGEGTNGRVSRLASAAGRLAVGGSFTRAGGLPANGISVWADGAFLEPSSKLFLPLLAR